MPINPSQVIPTPSQASITQQQAVAARLNNRMLRQTWGSQQDMINAEAQLKQLQAQQAQMSTDYYRQTGTSPASIDNKQVEAQMLNARANMGAVEQRIAEFEYQLVANGTDEDQRQYAMARNALKDSYYQYQIAIEQGQSKQEAAQRAQQHMESYWPSLDRNYRRNFDPIAGEAVTRADTEKTEVIKDWRETFTAPPGQGVRWKYSQSESQRLYGEGNFTEAFAQVKMEGGVQTIYNPAEAAKKASIQSANTSLQNAGNLILQPGKNGQFILNRNVVWALNAGPISARLLAKPEDAIAGQQAKTYLLDAIEARFRAETGAAAREDEVERIWTRLGPSPWDSQDVIETKFQVFDKWINSALENMDPNMDVSARDQYMDRTLATIYDLTRQTNQANQTSTQSSALEVRGIQGPVRVIGVTPTQ